MRCTRCNRPAVPQAVGVTPAGVLAFGWCVPCLESVGCRPITVARRTRRPTTRLVLEPFSPPSPLYAAPRGPLDDRLRLAAAVAMMLSGWGVITFTTGLVLWAFGRPHAGPSPSGLGGAPGFRVGGPALLIGGGGATAAVGFLLWSLNSGLTSKRADRGLRWVQGLAFLSAFATLLAGIVFRSPRRDPLVVGIASAALTVSAAARWIEVRRSRPVAPWGPEIP